MKYHAVERWGGSEDEPSESRMRELLADLDENDPEHPSTWLTREDGWTLDVYESGLVIWDNMETSDGAVHMTGISREKALDMWLKLSRGEIETIQDEPWCPGQFPPRSAEEQAKILEEAAAITLAGFRKFYDLLGAERADVPCQHVGCQRGSIPLSVFCRPHHFQNTYHQPCPFQD